VFDRDATRRPQLTDAGRALAAEACAVLRSVDRLMAKARGMTGGLESEISLAVDVLLPSSRLTDAAQAFKAAFPTVSLRLHLEGLGAVTRLVMDGSASLGVCGAHHTTHPSLERMVAGGVELVPVAAPEHPLAAKGGLAPGDAADHIQLVLSDRSDVTEGRDFGVLARETWRMGDLSAKHALLLAGVGWGSMPRPMIADDLAAGRLVTLALPEWPRVDYAFVLAYRTDRPPGPAARWLIDRFLHQTTPAPAVDEASAAA
jgi:DNA-binding transcriptional LysR family regulator